LGAVSGLLPVRWLRERPLALVTVYAMVVAAIAFSQSRPVLLINDGDAYMEMARSMAHGTLEVPNGLDLVGSPELWIIHTVQRGAHLYAKYPPLYGVLAALPFALFGIRGMYLLDAIAFVATVSGFYLLARRVLRPPRALAATLLLPFAVPLVPYLLIELPHLVSLSLGVWAIVLWDRSRRARAPSRAGWLGLASGVALGLAVGVRLQNVVIVLPLLGVGFFHARHPRPTLLGLGAGSAACLAAIGVFNLQRFGTLNPFSYGPAIPEERADYFLRPAFLVVSALVVGLFLAARLLRSVRTAAVCATLGVVLVAVVAPLRAMARPMLTTTASLLINASVGGAGWGMPQYTHSWMNKALLVGAPFLVLGLVGVLACAARRARSLPTALAWTVVASLLFLSARDPDPRSLGGAMGFFSLNPRYLVDVMPALYLLAWRQIRGLRVGVACVAAGVVLGGVLLLRMATDRDDFSPYRVILLTDGSVALAAAALVAYLARRWRAGAGALALAVALTHGYAAACTLGEDSLAYATLASRFERWGQRVRDATPEKVALVGWGFDKDPVYFLRAEKTMVTVDAERDGAASLADTLDALVDHGLAPFYYDDGPEMEATVKPRLAGRYRVVAVLGDPRLSRLERIGGAR
jgi:hypothetical protein